jgi:hypothetical protein
MEVWYLIDRVVNIFFVHELEKLYCITYDSWEGYENQRIETAFVQTLRANYKGYTKKEVLKAKEAQCAQALIGNPSKGVYKGLVSSKMIAN